MNNFEYEKNRLEGIGEISEKAAEKTSNFFKKAFDDMKESAKAQHEVDKANFQAVRAESRAQWEEAKMSPKARAEKMQKEREEQIAAAKERTAVATARIENAKSSK